MSTAAPAGCARCGTILEPHFRFCPECALPATGEGPMSTEIAELGRRADHGPRPRARPEWTRYLLPVVATAMLTFVVAMGLTLFNRSMLDRLLPPEDPAEEPVAEVPHAPRWEPEWIKVPKGRFKAGPDGRDAEIDYDFWMAKTEVTNALWHDYLVSERSRLRGDLWAEAWPRRVEGWSLDPSGIPALAPARRQFPITEVTPVAIADFASWLTRRLDKPGFEIRMPTQLEWEYAARGTDGRTYPWGEALSVTVPRTGGERARAGIHSLLYPVDDPALAADDTSPFGVIALGTNVSEWTVMPDRATGAPEREVMEAFPSAHDLRAAIVALELRVAWRGASHATDSGGPAARAARTWAYTVSEKSDAKADVGVRLVKVRTRK